VIGAPAWRFYVFRKQEILLEGYEGEIPVGARRRGMTVAKWMARRSAGRGSEYRPVIPTRNRGAVER